MGHDCRRGLVVAPGSWQGCQFRSQDSSQVLSVLVLSSFFFDQDRSSAILHPDDAVKLEVDLETPDGDLFRLGFRSDWALRTWSMALSRAVGRYCCSRHVFLCADLSRPFPGIRVHDVPSRTGVVGRDRRNSLVEVTNPLFTPVEPPVVTVNPVFGVARAGTLLGLERRVRNPIFGNDNAAQLLSPPGVLCFVVFLVFLIFLGNSGKRKPIPTFKTQSSSPELGSVRRVENPLFRMLSSESILPRAPEAPKERGESEK